MTNVLEIITSVMRSTNLEKYHKQMSFDEMINTDFGFNGKEFFTNLGIYKKLLGSVYLSIEKIKKQTNGN